MQTYYPFSAHEDAFTAANLPALVSLFKFDEALTATNTVFTDSVSGAAVTISTANLTKNTYSLKSTRAAADGVSSGTLPSIASTENFIVFGTAIVGTGDAVGYGNIVSGSTPYIGLYETGGSIHLTAGLDVGVGNYVDFASGAAPHATNVRAFAVWGKASAGGAIYGCIDGTAAATANITNAVAIACTLITLTGGAEAFELGMLKPTTLPSTAFIQGMVNWLAYQANLGNKYAYPAALGLA